MTTELLCLVLNALWGSVLVSIEILGKTRIAGSAWNRGNRAEAPSFPPWLDRAGRALANHKENFPLFLTAVLVIHLTGNADRVTATAAVVYVVARVLHGVLYLGGVKGVRTVVWLVGMGATLAMFSRLMP